MGQNEQQNAKGKNKMLKANRKKFQRNGNICDSVNNKTKVRKGKKETHCKNS